MSGLACTNQSKEEEDATELKLGEDFNTAAALSMNEVMLVCQSKQGGGRRRSWRRDVDDDHPGV